MSEFIRTAIMKFMQGHVGKFNAIIKDRIIVYLGIYGVTEKQERGVRDLLASLPLCSCPNGWFIPNYKNVPAGTAEVLEFKEKLAIAHGHRTAAIRCSIIYSFYPMLIPPAEQGKFNFEGMGEGA